MCKSHFLLLLTALASLIMTETLSAHPGGLDSNGGHYMGPSYHCHLTGCEMPDTFDRMGRDSFFTDYEEREKFFNPEDWDFEQDYDNDCQSTRQEMLILTSRDVVTYTNPRNCVVRTGMWVDEYTGENFTVATQLELDHIIPPLYAQVHGGDLWPPEKKLAFANDPLNLMLVARQEVRRKNSRGPDRYLPREEFQCQYARLWEIIAEKYDLTLETRDRSRLSRILQECPESGGDSSQDGR